MLISIVKIGSWEEKEHELIPPLKKGWAKLSSVCQHYLPKYRMYWFSYHHIRKSDLDIINAVVLLERNDEIGTVMGNM